MFLFEKWLFDGEFRIVYVKTTTSLEIDGCTLWAIAIGKERLRYDGDWHVVACELDHASKYAFESLIYVGLQPNLGKLVNRVQGHIAVEDGRTIRADHHLVRILFERELLNSVARHVVCATLQAIDMLERVPLEIMRLFYYHIDV